MHLFSKIAEVRIPTDMIVQNIGQDGRTDISFTVPGADLVATLETLQAIVPEIDAAFSSKVGVEWQENVVKVSAVGLEMEKQGGVAKKMFKAISQQNINIGIITTSEIKISALVSRDDGLATLRAVHGAFGLEKAPKKVKNRPNQKAVPFAKKNLAEAEMMDVSRLSGMEDILIESIHLNQTEAQITMPNVPDIPGAAADLFERIAAGNIVVDMIVQSCGRNGKAIITYTMPREALDKALEITRKLAKKWGSDEPLHNPAIAILSVRGTGLRSHTELAYRMFKTLADNKINVNVISTSERNIAVTVDEKNGEKGLKLLKKEFAGEMM
jgi:aspartate kinase